MNHLVSPSLVLISVAAAAVVSALTLLSSRRQTVAGHRRPPGPVPLPLIGNLFGIDAKKPWVTYAEWGTRYGDIFMIRVLKQDIIVINSVKIAKDLLERRSGVYSDRPDIAARDPYGWSFHFAWARYGDRWRSQRRIFHQSFRPDAAITFLPTHLRKAREFILDILNTPRDYFAHVQRFSAAVIMSVVYDYDVAQGHDHLVELFERGSVLAFEALTPEVSSIIDAFPFVLTLSLPKWFPGADLRQKAASSRRYARQMVEEPFEHAIKREADGSSTSAMALDLLKRMKSSDDPSRLQIFKDTCTTAFIAGAETTASTLKCFMLAMLQNPEAQEKAQREIDAVVGTKRLPDFEDRPNLPYVEAIMLETFRIYSIVPLGVPHATTADDVYEGIFIPKGSTVVTNIWAMDHNEEVYPEPHVFKPERYLNNGKLNGTKFIDSAGFGFGRRVCPGRYASDSSIWIAIVSLLSTFKITKALDEKGKEVEFEPSFITGVTSYPKPFPCTLTPRLSAIDIRRLSTVAI